MPKHSGARSSHLFPAPSSAAGWWILYFGNDFIPISQIYFLFFSCGFTKNDYAYHMFSQQRTSDSARFAHEHQPAQTWGWAEMFTSTLWNTTEEHQPQADHLPTDVLNSTSKCCMCFNPSLSCLMKPGEQLTEACPMGRDQTIISQASKHWAQQPYTWNLPAWH